MRNLEELTADHDDCVVALAVALAQQHSPLTVKALEKRLKESRKELTDAISCHSHGQYVLRTEGLP